MLPASVRHPLCLKSTLRGRSQAEDHTGCLCVCPLSSPPGPSCRHGQPRPTCPYLQCRLPSPRRPHADAREPRCHWTPPPGPPRPEPRRGPGHRHGRLQPHCGPGGGHNIPQARPGLRPRPQDSGRPAGPVSSSLWTAQDGHRGLKPASTCHLPPASPEQPAQNRGQAGPNVPNCPQARRRCLVERKLKPCPRCHIQPPRCCPRAPLTCEGL
jgi:hypothetical protein